VQCCQIETGLQGYQKWRGERERQRVVTIKIPSKLPGRDQLVLYNSLKKDAYFMINNLNKQQISFKMNFCFLAFDSSFEPLDCDQYCLGCRDCEDQRCKCPPSKYRISQLMV
jgi:hypothetical protein